MKRAAIICLLAYALSLSATALAEGAVSGCEVEGSADKPDGSREGKDARYERIMRDLEREYQAGDLTETEYIQRKREIENLDL